jgi:hypothetical protein
MIAVLISFIVSLLFLRDEIFEDIDKNLCGRLREKDRLPC